jgi:hypothetical protein
MATSDRKPYLTAPALTQALLDQCQDNLEGKLEMVADIETPAGFIRVSDRNKYVGTTFYKAATKFPAIKRTLGDWLSPELEFSSLTLQISNVDGWLNHLLPAGGDFAGWIGKSVQVRVGLRDVAASYTVLFTGTITEVGGMQRSVAAITLVARDRFDVLNTEVPTTVFTKETYADLDPNLVGIAVPVIYGNWTVATNNDRASVPAYPVNSNNANVKLGTANLLLHIAANALVTFDTANVWLRRGSDFTLVSSSNITNVAADKRTFEIIQGIGYTWQDGDQFFVRVKGKDLGAYSDNAVAIARDMLETYGGLTSGDFATAWNTFRDKATPAQDAIAAHKARVWLQEPQKLMAFVASLLEQVRVEPFLARDLTLALNSLHFSDWVAAPSHTVKNWDVMRGTFTPQLDDKNQWNRARGEFGFDPLSNGNIQQTPIFKNAAAIAQVGKAISKKVVFPNLYEPATVEKQLQEMLKLASSYAEMVEMQLTGRAVLKDLGDFVAVDVKIGATQFDGVPAMVREISYDPKGMLPMRVWSMQMVPFPGWAPGYAGIVGGASAVITQET